MFMKSKPFFALLSVALTAVLAPGLAFADKESEGGYQQETESTAVMQHAVVYDKADYYKEAPESDSATSGLRAGESMMSPDSPSLSPVYLSAEFKYFNKYESGGNYDQGFSYGDGYHALGAYQFDHRYVLKSFLSDCYSYDPTTFSMFAQFESISDSDFKKEGAIYADGAFTDLGNALNKAWHDAYKANPTLFAALQDAWAYNNYYVPIENYLAGRGIDISNRADCVRGLCWGLTSLFGQGGVRLFVGGTTSAYDWDGNWVTREWPGCGLNNSMTDIEFVTALCNYVADNVSVFYKAQPQYHAGWSNRYRNELKDCLSYLGTWEKVGDRWKYKQKDGYATNCWLKINSVWYWFDADGYAAQNGFKFINGTWYYFNSDCGMLESTWKKVNGFWYYFDSSGAMATGWLKLGNQWRYMDEVEGAMRTGWVFWQNDWYYLDPANDGVMHTGWLELNGSHRYMGSSGAMKTGWLWDDGAWYYFNPDNDGIMHIGWLELDGERRFMGETGAMQTTWLFWKGDWYYLDPANDGVAHEGWLLQAGKWRYLDEENGAMRTGWVFWQNDWYYLDPANDGVMHTGWLLDDQDWYYLWSSGKMVRNMWIGDYYLLDDGRMAVNQWIGEWYVGADGKWIPGYEETESNYVYVASNGRGTRYHSTAACDDLSGAIKLSLGDAASKGYAACPKCVQQ